MAREMDTGWFHLNARLDPWSYRNLLRRMRDLQERDPSRPANESVALRHILRRARPLKTGIVDPPAGDDEDEGPETDR